jgi:hypothetical protein
MINLLFTGLLALLLLSALAAPLESLGWWAGWFGEREPAPDAAGPLAPTAQARAENPARHYMVYLSGIGAITDSSLPAEEIEWLDRFEPKLPGTELVREVFPYSVTNAGLTGNRMFRRSWTYMEKLRLKNEKNLLTMTINLRNLFHVLVSGDSRYGPIYSLGVAQEIVKALELRGYRLGSGIPVTVLGWSGGGQVAVGAATFLRRMLGAPIRVVSVGGLLSNDPGLDHVTRLYHFYGDKDPIQAMGGKMYIGRWKWFPESHWNRAMRRGVIVMTSLGPFSHNGAGNYFDWTTIAPDGRPYAEVTMDAIADALRAEGVLDQPKATAA